MMNIQKPNIGNNLRLARKDAGLTQAQLSGLLRDRFGPEGPNQATIGNWENGKYDVPAIAIWQISIITNKPIEYFYNETQKREHQENEIDELKRELKGIKNEKTLQIEDLRIIIRQELERAGKSCEHHSDAARGQSTRRCLSR